MIISFGEILWDLFPDGRRILGGAPFNLACRLALLGRKSLMASRLGRDDPGREAFEQASALGVDTSLLQWDDRLPTGSVRVSLDRAGEPDFYIVPEVAYDRIKPTAKLLSAAANAQCICFGTLAQRSPQSRDTLLKVLEAAERSLKFLDINLRKDCYSDSTVRGSVVRADVLKLNAEEAPRVAEILFGREMNPVEFAGQAIAEYGPKACLVTLGERGVFAADSSGGRVYLPGYRVEVVDTVGAGDAFSAGFIHSWLSGLTLARACDSGCRLGALVAASAGATARIERDEIDRIEGAEKNIDPAFAKFK